MRHKVDLPNDLMRGKSARLSITYFVHTNDDIAINQRLACVGGIKVIENDNWKPILMVDYIEQKLNANFDTPFKL